MYWVPGKETNGQGDGTCLTWDFFKSNSPNLWRTIEKEQKHKWIQGAYERRCHRRNPVAFSGFAMSVMFLLRFSLKLLWPSHEKTTKMPFFTDWLICNFRECHPIIIVQRIRVTSCFCQLPRPTDLWAFDQQDSTEMRDACLCVYYVWLTPNICILLSRLSRLWTCHFRMSQEVRTQFLFLINVSDLERQRAISEAYTSSTASGSSPYLNFSECMTNTEMEET